MSIINPTLKTMSEYVRRSYLPNLVNNSFTYESKATGKYNCMAWSLGMINKWIDHEQPYYWPPALPQKPHIDSYIKFYEMNGFTICHDGLYQDGYEKIVLYSDEYKMWQHVAFQLNKSKWACKMGRWEDIYHNNEYCLCDGMYGSTLTYMRRKTNWQRKLKRKILIIWIKILSIGS